MTHLVTTDGTVVTLGRTTLPIHFGSHAGEWWRLDEIFHDGTQHMLRCSRLHRGKVRVRKVFAPVHFALEVMEEITHMRALVNRVHHTWQKIDEGLIMGVLALVPLALFEAFHGGEATRHLLESLFNSSVNTGGH